MDFGKKAAEARHEADRRYRGLHFAPGSRLERQPTDGSTASGRKNYYHLVLLAENYTGYKNLIKLSLGGLSRRFLLPPHESTRNCCWTSTARD